jgi:hypothetical protein
MLIDLRKEVDMTQFLSSALPFPSFFLSSPPLLTASPSSLREESEGLTAKTKIFQGQLSEELKQILEHIYFTLFTNRRLHEKYGPKLEKVYPELRAKRLASTARWTL